MCGFPLAGVVFSHRAVEQAVADPFRFALFVGATVCLAQSVYAFNSWGGAARDRVNPRLTGTTGARGPLARALVALVLSLLLYALAGVFHAGALALLIYLLWVAYSHPAIDVKGRPPWASVLHVGAGCLMVWLGASWGGAPGSDGLVAGLFLGLAFAAGHLNHELIDREADQRAGTRTSAVVYGVGPVRRVSLVLFGLSYGILGLGVALGLVPFGVSLPFLVVAPVHGVLGIRCSDAERQSAVVRYRWRYRLLFALAGVVAVAFALHGAVAPR